MKTSAAFTVKLSLLGPPYSRALTTAFVIYKGSSKLKLLAFTFLVDQKVDHAKNFGIATSQLCTSAIFAIDD